MFIDFICSNWQWLVSVLIGLLSIIVVIFKKRYKVIDYFSQLAIVIPDFINEAENSFSLGKDKFTYVFSKCVVYLCEVSNLSEAKVINNYGKLINSFIEGCLSTPQKKEV